MKTKGKSSQPSLAETGHPVVTAPAAALGLRYSALTDGRQGKHYRMYLERKIFAMAALMGQEQLQLKTLSEERHLLKGLARAQRAQKQEFPRRQVSGRRKKRRRRRW